MDLYQVSPFFFLRQASISLKDLEAVLSSPDRKRSLLDFYKTNAFFRLSIAIASPELHKSLKKETYNTAFQNQQIYLSVLKYLLRAATRTTPFGLFASIAYGRFEDREDLSESSKIQKRIRPDATWMTQATRKFFDLTKDSKNFKVMANPSILLKGDTFYLFEQLSVEGSSKLATIEASKYSKLIFEKSSRPIDYQILLQDLLRSYQEEDREKIETTLLCLIDKGFLLTEAAIQLKNPRFFYELVQKIKNLNKENLIFDIEHLLKLVSDFEEAESELALEKLEEIYVSLNRLIKLPYPVQVDSAKKEIVRLPQKIAKAIEILPPLLASFQGARSANRKTQKFHEEFLECFGTDVLVPLKTALERLDYKPDQKKEASHPELLEALFFERLNSEELRSIDLSEEEIKKYLSKIDRKKLPSSCELFFEVLASSLLDIEKGNFTILLNPNLATQSAASSLGRFLYLFDSNVSDEVKKFLKIEEHNHPDLAFVEASFLPTSSRTVNVAFFQSLRDYHLGLEYQDATAGSLYLDDIYLGANLNNLYIFSKKLNKKLHVFLGTAVNDSLAPLPLRLLIDISNAQSMTIHPFPWIFASKQSYLPELRYKNIIFSPRRWFIKGDEKTKIASDPERKLFLSQTFRERQIPPQVLLCLYDHRLRLNWEKADEFEIINQQFRASNELTLFESLHGKYGTPWTMTGQHHQGEIAVSFVLKDNSRHTDFKKRDEPVEWLQDQKNRCLNFQSSCFYAKIYMNADQQTEFLKNWIIPWINQLSGNKLLSHWFFIRYRDARSHIRLRIFSENTAKIFEEFSRVSDIWLKNQLVSDASIHIYERELERYGGEECIDSMEKFFCVDSILSLQLLQHFRDEERENYPLFSIAAINVLLIVRAFFEKEESFAEFFGDFESDASHLAGVRQFYKPLVKYTFGILTANDFLYEEKDPFLITLLPISQTFRGYCFQLAEEMRGKHLSTFQISKMTHSLIHMHCNRLLGVDLDLEKKARSFSEFLSKKIKQLESLSCI